MRLHVYVLISKRVSLDASNFEFGKMDFRFAILALLIHFGNAKNLASPEKVQDVEVKIETDVRLTK